MRVEFLRQRSSVRLRRKRKFRARCAPSAETPRLRSRSSIFRRVRGTAGRKFLCALIRPSCSGRDVAAQAATHKTSDFFNGLFKSAGTFGFGTKSKGESSRGAIQQVLRRDASQTE